MNSWGKTVSNEMTKVEGVVSAIWPKASNKNGSQKPTNQSKQQAVSTCSSPALHYHCNTGYSAFVDKFIIQLKETVICIVQLYSRRSNVPTNPATKMLLLSVTHSIDIRVRSEIQSTQNSNESKLTFCSTRNVLNCISFNNILDEILSLQRIHLHW